MIKVGHYINHKKYKGFVVFGWKYWLSWTNLTHQIKVPATKYCLKQPENTLDEEAAFTKFLICEKNRFTVVPIGKFTSTVLWRKSANFRWV